MSRNQYNVESLVHLKPKLILALLFCFPQGIKKYPVFGVDLKSIMTCVINFKFPRMSNERARSFRVSFLDRRCFNLKLFIFLLMACLV